MKGFKVFYTMLRRCNVKGNIFNEIHVMHMCIQEQNCYYFFQHFNVEIVKRTQM